MRDPVQWAYDLQHFGIKLGLDNIRALLELLEHPEHAYPSMLVAGTNGKGSVGAIVSALLDAHGARSGLFSSPHLVRPNERIRVGGRDVTTEELHALLDGIRVRVEAAVESGELAAHPSFFEVMTASALCAFRDGGSRAAVLEVGLGGRLDATNAVDAAVSVIVSIGLDHMKTLGPSLPRIAGEKAGIVKPGRPLVCGVHRPAALGVIERRCAELDAPIVLVDRVSRVVAERNERFRVETERGRYDDLRLSLAGSHQWRNAQVALVAFERLADVLGIAPEPLRVREALASVRWAGRLQWVEGAPPMLLDGAHNADGAATLADYLERRSIRPRAMLFGGMRGKQFDRILETLAPYVERVVVTRPGVNRSEEPAVIAGIARRYVDHVETAEPPMEALERARRLAGTDGPLLVCGSLYLVGQVLASLEREPVPGPVAL